MKPDVYTKAILTLIALLLAVVALRSLPLAHAADAENQLQFDPTIEQFGVPGAAASLLGRVAIDMRTGNVYGFPTDGRPYPFNLQSSQPGVAKPILLGRFDLSDLPQK
jgi:hypothetical protein